MTASGAAPTVARDSTKVPVGESRQVEVEPGKPWPSAYRGSKYSIISSRNHGDVVQWSHMGNVQAMTKIPNGLKEELRNLGKPDGHGSFRITASGEVLSKVPASRYRDRDEAPVENGFIPVYVGKLEGNFDFQEFSNNPTPPPEIGELRVWSGLPFNHGETWAVCTDDVLRWNWQDHYFESAFDHPEIVATYKTIRPVGGRIYINEHGHIWGNIDRNEVPKNEKTKISQAFQNWQRKASPAEKRLVTRRLKRTESEAAKDGLLPVYLGHVSQFDDGLIPKPVVDNKSYFRDSTTDPDQ